MKCYELHDQCDVACDLKDSRRWIEYEEDLNCSEISIKKHGKMGLREDMPFTKIPGMYQYNAIPNNEDTSQTAYWMQKTYEHLYGPLK